MNKQIWTWIALGVIVIVVIVLISGRDSSVPVIDDEAVYDTDIVTGETGGESAETPSIPRSSTPRPIVAQNPVPTPINPVTTENRTVLHKVQYLESGGFIPRTVTLKVGDSVNFENIGTKDMWIQGVNYPGSGVSFCGTANETVSFDQCEVGKSYSFTLNQKGTWQYANKYANYHGGTLIVE